MTKITDYKFNVGDEVVNIFGRRGRIIHICDCSDCEKRGFYEPAWEDDTSKEVYYITNYDAEGGFTDYYRIGKYRFNEFDKDYIKRRIKKYEQKIQALKWHLKIMEEEERKSNENNY